MKKITLEMVEDAFDVQHKAFLKSLKAKQVLDKAIADERIARSEYQTAKSAVHELERAANDAMDMKDLLLTAAVINKANNPDAPKKIAVTLEKEMGGGELVVA